MIVKDVDAVNNLADPVGWKMLETGGFLLATQLVELDDEIAEDGVEGHILPGFVLNSIVLFHQIISFQSIRVIGSAINIHLIVGGCSHHPHSYTLYTI